MLRFCNPRRWALHCSCFMPLTAAVSPKRGVPVTFNSCCCSQAGILGQFVFTQIEQEFANQSALLGRGAMVGASGVSHVAHLAGAAAGVLLIVLLSRLPGDDA